MPATPGGAGRGGGGRRRGRTRQPTPARPGGAAGPARPGGRRVRGRCRSAAASGGCPLPLGSSCPGGGPGPGGRFEVWVRGWPRPEGSWAPPRLPAGGGGRGKGGGGREGPPSPTPAAESELGERRLGAGRRRERGRGAASRGSRRVSGARRQRDSEEGRGEHGGAERCGAGPGGRRLLRQRPGGAAGTPAAERAMRVVRWLAGLLCPLSVLVTESWGVRFHPGQGKQVATKAATAPGVLALRQAPCTAEQALLPRPRWGRRERFLTGRVGDGGEAVWGRPAAAGGGAGATGAESGRACWRQPPAPLLSLEPLASAASAVPGAVWVRVEVASVPWRQAESLAFYCRDFSEAALLL